MNNTLSVYIEVRVWCMYVYTHATYIHAGNGFLDKFKNKPTPKMLSRVKQHFAYHWKDVALELLNHADVKSIEFNDQYKTPEEKCFAMLEKWLETSSNPCYCDLIKALEQYNLNNAIDIIKKQVLEGT